MATDIVEDLCINMGRVELQLVAIQRLLVKRLDIYSRAIAESNNMLRKLPILRAMLSIVGNDEALHLLYRGMYIWGGVGRGKSVLLNRFFDNLPCHNKKRMHFHHFMLEFHSTLHYLQSKACSSKITDLVMSAAASIVPQNGVLCLDELRVDNITDAMVLQRLFSALLAKQRAWIFITSNFSPGELFKDGLQRERFLPFIELVKDKLEVFHLNHPIDYRLANITQLGKKYHFPLDDSAAKYTEFVIKAAIGEHTLGPMKVAILPNRVIEVLHAYDRFALFSFAELCGLPMGVSDYIALCYRFSTVVITDIPQMVNDDHNEALRFITLVDCMYEAKTNLICTASVAIDELYIGNKHKMEFSRTVSRLHEMQGCNFSVKRDCNVEFSIIDDKKNVPT